jgi:hypothetical protein
MTAIRRGLFVLLLVALALTRAPAISPLPPNPHQSMNEAGACAGCHAYYGGALDPHAFVVAIPEKCMECHSPDKLGRSHPIGVDPSLLPANIVQVPEELPLENGMVSCGSCHNPHMDYLSKTRAFDRAPAEFIQISDNVEIPWYKSLYLRKSDPIKGFEPLCLACHRDY